MTLDPTTLLAIVLMAAASYATRVSGLLIAGRFQPAGRAKAAFDAIPAAVLTAVIAPTLLATGPAETLAGIVTLVAAFRLPLLATILVGVSAVVLSRGLLG
jgi:uncharacterized membrane protein